MIHYPALWFYLMVDKLVLFDAIPRCRWINTATLKSMSNCSISRGVLLSYCLHVFEENSSDDSKTVDDTVICCGEVGRAFVAMLIAAGRLMFAVLTSKTLMRNTLHPIGEQTKVNC